MRKTKALALSLALLPMVVTMARHGVSPWMIFAEIIWVIILIAMLKKRLGN